jgi:hypothetical protein
VVLSEGRVFGRPGGWQALNVAREWELFFWPAADSERGNDRQSSVECREAACNNLVFEVAKETSKSALFFHMIFPASAEKLPVLANIFPVILRREL